MNDLLRFRPEVVTDLDHAAKWYDGRSTGLGAEFLAECKAALDRIVENPERVAADSQGVRSSRILRFPYVIHYRIERTAIVVFAVSLAGAIRRHGLTGCERPERVSIAGPPSLICPSNRPFDDANVTSRERPIDFVLW